MVEPLRGEDIEVREFQFDGRNRAHFSHGLSEEIVWEVWEGEPLGFENPPPAGRSGSHLMIGPAADGRIWTVVIVLIDDELGLWRPITGWPSTRKETRAWQGEN